MVSGIWHGANWTFIVWGCIHGVCQIIEKMLGEQKCKYGWLGKTVKILITFLIVNFAWLFFRMPTLAHACGVIGRIFDPSLPMTVFIAPLPTPPLIVVMVLWLLAKDLRDEFFPNRVPLMYSSSVIIRWATYIFLIVTILSSGVLGSDQFIYA